jgi:hypothetical protein
VAAVRPLVVVDVFPVIYDRVRLDHRVERLDRGHLVADTGAERLHERVYHGEPGSMKLRSAQLKRQQSRKALAVISGPLSIRTSSGPAPRSRTIWSSTRVENPPLSGGLARLGRDEALVEREGDRAAACEGID